MNIHCFISKAVVVYGAWQVQTAITMYVVSIYLPKHNITIIVNTVI